MSKLAVTITAASLCAGSMVPLRAEAMTFAALASLRPAIDGTNSVEKAACGWYPADYPQSWAVYTRGWGCRQVYSPYYYDAYSYRPYYGAYGPPVGYRRPHRWWWAWY